MSRPSTSLSRRAAIVGGATSAVGLLAASPAFAAPARALPAVPTGPRHLAPAATRPATGPAHVMAATLPALRAGENAYIVFGANLTASASAAGSGTVYVTSLSGCYSTPAAGSWLGLTCDVPAGSLITGVDCVAAGNPRSASAAAWCDQHDPIATGFAGTIANSYFSAGNGPETVTLALNKTFTGTEVFDVYFSGLSATTVARAIRVRYVPPPAPTPPPATAAGLVPIGPFRIFDSGKSNVGTTYRPVQIAGKAGVPSNATAALLTTQIIAPTATGIVRVMPYGKDDGMTTQAFAKGERTCGTSLVRLANGKVQVKLSAGNARVLMEVYGYIV